MPRLTYQERKASGLCVEHGCPNPPGETVRCDQHAAAVKARQAAWYKKQPKQKVRRWRAAWIAKRVATGKCLRCERPALHQLCPVHAQEARDRARRNDKRPRQGRVTRCSWCREPGHRVGSCPARLAWAGVA